MQFCLNYPDRISQKDLNLIINKAPSAYGTAPKNARAMAQMILEKKKPSTRKGPALKGFKPAFKNAFKPGFKSAFKVLK